MLTVTLSLNPGWLATEHGGSLRRWTEDLTEVAETIDPGFDRLVPSSWLNEQTPMMRDFLTKYAYPAHDQPDMLVIEIDNGRFMNHSLAPNTDFTKVIEGYALRDIAAGEELICNYSEFDPGFELLPSVVAAFSVREKAKANGVAAH